MNDPIAKAIDRAIAIFLEDLREHGCSSCIHTAESIIAGLKKERDRDDAIQQARWNQETIKGMRE